MSTPINLNKFRKEKARTDKRVKAGENSVKFGRTKAQKAAEHVQTEQVKTYLDGHKLDKPE
jgi:hypothetical protein